MGHPLVSLLPFALAMIFALILSGCESVFDGFGSSDEDSSHGENGVTATELWEEKQSNPVRFEKTYVSNEVTVTGEVWEVSRQRVDLVVNEKVYKSTGFILATVRLLGFSEEEILLMDKGKDITAVCTVEENDWFIVLGSCTLRSN